MTAICERHDNVKIEYRLHPARPKGVLRLQHRELRLDGHPHDGRWYPVSDATLLDLQLAGSDVISRLNGLAAWEDSQ